MYGTPTVSYFLESPAVGLPVITCVYMRACVGVGGGGRGAGALRARRRRAWDALSTLATPPCLVPTRPCVHLPLRLSLLLVAHCFKQSYSISLSLTTTTKCRHDVSLYKQHEILYHAYTISTWFFIRVIISSISVSPNVILFIWYVLYIIF